MRLPHYATEGLRCPGPEDALSPRYGHRPRYGLPLDELGDATGCWGWHCPVSDLLFVGYLMPCIIDSREAVPLPRLIRDVPNIV